MNTAEKKRVIADTLIEIIGALEEGAAGPCHYWYIKLAERLAERAKCLLKETANEIAPYSYENLKGVES